MPVSETVLTPALNILAGWATKEKVPTPSAPLPSPSLPTAPGWPEWAAGQLALLRRDV
ncbi:hypothetical protein ACWGQ5_46945 [Streptomyces sp. NPDC055722]